MSKYILFIKELVFNVNVILGEETKGNPMDETA